MKTRMKVMWIAVVLAVIVDSATDVIQTAIVRVETVKAESVDRVRLLSKLSIPFVTTILARLFSRCLVGRIHRAH